MIPEASVPLYCDGEQHQLFPGIDLNCIEACDETCPNDCCDKVSCCADEECIASCDLLCDGYLGCDHPPDCLEAHCDSPDCDGQSPPCFDEHCLETVDDGALVGSALRKKRKLSHIYVPDAEDGEPHKVFAPIPQVFSPTSQQLAYQTNAHKPACFGHTEACPEGCVNPMHLSLQPNLCQHLVYPWFNRMQPPVNMSEPSTDGIRSTYSHSPREGSIASTPYLTHSSESRPSTACSMRIDLGDSFFGDKPIQCCCINPDGQICGQCFPDSGSLNYHILDCHIYKTRRVNETSEGFYCCWAGCPRHLNNQPFTSIGKIESHYLSHSGYKGWRCDLCGRIYAREGSLDRHRQTHINDKMYKCHICGKTTTDKNQLKIHIRSHTGEKPYKCDFPGCNHRASDSTNMTKHKKTHQPRTHFCPFPGCNRMFVRSDGLKRHMKTCKAGKDFEQALDQANFSTQATFA